MRRRDVIKALSFALSFRTFLPETAASLPGRGDRPLCLDYLDRVVGMFEKIRATEPDELLEASARIAETHRRGGTCFCQWETGHSFDGDMFPDRYGDPDIFVMGYTMGKPPVEPKAGDLIIVNVLRKPLDDPRRKDIFVIGGQTPWCADTDRPELLTDTNRRLEIRKYSDIWINTYTTTHGALMWLPGADAPLGPTSGALGMVTYWSMIADAVRILARDGVTVGIKGDEPALSDSAAYADVDSPLAGSYFDTAIRQIRFIEAELGTIERIAEKAVDCILSGGSLYVYSRHQQALSAEARGKRGGLALIKTTHAEDTAFAGTENDFMIMGIYSPDDEVDLRMLRSFKSKGMSVAAIGPSTCGLKTPEGATVPGEADFHLGLMCDTYGLFAVPGVERRICPTSGLLVNLMFWAVVIQIAGEIMARTGNTPAVLSTGALKGGGEQRRRSMAVVRERGY